MKLISEFILLFYKESAGIQVKISRCIISQPIVRQVKKYDLDRENIKKIVKKTYIFYKEKINKMDSKKKESRGN